MREQAASAERRSAEATQAAEKLQARIDAVLAAQASSAEAAREDDRQRINAMETLRADKAALAVALAAARLDGVMGKDGAAVAKQPAVRGASDGDPRPSAESRPRSEQEERADSSGRASARPI